MSASPYVSVQYGGDINITEDILYQTELYCKILKYGIGKNIDLPRDNTALFN
jgi:hypothetical protein